MPIEEFSPEPPPPKANPGAMWAGFVLVALAVIGGIGVYWFVTSQQGGNTAPGVNPSPAADLPPPVRMPSVVEVTDDAIRASTAEGLALGVTDVATSPRDAIVSWAGRIVLTNGGTNPIQVEMPDGGNTYLEVETADGVRVRSRQESRPQQRLPLAPGASTSSEWQDEFDRGVKRFRFVHVEAGEVRRVIVSPWIDLPGGGK